MRILKLALSLVALFITGTVFAAAAAGAATPPSPIDDGQPVTGGSGGICRTNDACWIDGAGTYQYFPNCIVGGYGHVYTYVGYWGKDDFSYPQTDDRYWGHIVSGVVGSSCGGEFIGTDVELPAATQFDLDNTPDGKIRCFYTSGKTGNTEEITNNSNADCRQNPGAGVHGGWGLGGRVIPAYGTFEVIFPIKSSQENLGTSKLRAALDTALSSPKIAYPQAMVAVTARPTVPNPNPTPTPTPTPTPSPTPTPTPDPDPDPVDPADPIDPNAPADPDPVNPVNPRTTPLTAKLAPAGRKLTLSGVVVADRSGESVEATLMRSAKKGKPFREIDSAAAAVGADGAYSLAFKRPKKGKCRATVTIDANPGSGYEAATTTVSGRC